MKGGFSVSREESATQSPREAQGLRLALSGVLSLAMLAGILFAVRRTPRESAPSLQETPPPVELVTLPPPSPAPPPRTPLREPPPPETPPVRKESPAASLPPPPRPILPPPPMLEEIPAESPVALPTPPPRETIPAPPLEEEATDPPREEETTAVETPSGDSPYEVSQVERLPVAQGGIPVHFPARARRQGVSGQAVVEFVVSRQGVPEQIQVVSASPPGYFEEAAREAVEKARFQPALREGKPVPCRLRLPLEFHIEL
ncbi:MAG: TonB family protein [Oligosphaeraceae bacterium]